MLNLHAGYQSIQFFGRGVISAGQMLVELREEGLEAPVDEEVVRARCDRGERHGRTAVSEQEQARVAILMGSDSDLPVMRAAADFLKDMGVEYEITVASAHRTPARVMEYTSSAAERGVKIIIAGAGMAAHLAGVIASHTDLPVIGVPLDASPLGGMDSLLATVQMPPGIPVATMGIGKAGARNAAVLACRILALEDRGIAKKLVGFREKMVQEVNDKARNIAL